MKNIGKIAMILVSILCVGILVYFVFFFGDAKNENATVTTVAKKSYTITFDTDTLTYNKDTNLMQGVTAKDENGTDLTNDVTVSCKPTNNIAIKELTYSINKADYKIESFTRKLVVDGNYTGPSITTDNENIEIPINEINSLSSIISKSDCVKTDDGFGRKCAITAVFSTDVTDIGEYIIKITAENILGDTASTKMLVTVTDSNSSIIKLTTTAITINVGDKFNPEQYIKSAVHEEMGDITASVQWVSNVDTKNAGHYTVVYSFGTQIDSLKNEQATLYVTVQ